jgi:hypothetical protein
MLMIATAVPAVTSQNNNAYSTIHISTIDTTSSSHVYCTVTGTVVNSSGQPQGTPTPRRYKFSFVYFIGDAYIDSKERVGFFRWNMELTRYTGLMEFSKGGAVPPVHQVSLKNFIGLIELAPDSDDVIREIKIGTVVGLKYLNPTLHFPQE